MKPINGAENGGRNRENNKPLLIKYPLKKGDYIRIMFQGIVAIEPVGDSECIIYTSAGKFEIALSDETVLKDLSGYKY